jgi:hypothetical protein
VSQPPNAALAAAADSATQITAALSEIAHVADNLDTLKTKLAHGGVDPIITNMVTSFARRLRIAAAVIQRGAAQ